MKMLVKLWRKCINTISVLFHLDNKKEIEITKQPIQKEVSLEEELENESCFTLMKENISFISPSDSTEKYSDEQIRLYHKLKEGDMIWAQMPLSKEALSTIPFSHQIRPYLIMKKENEKMYCYPCSSTKKSISSFLRYPISKELYSVQKDGWIYLKDIFCIPLENLRGFFCSLTATDKKGISHRLQVAQEKQYYHVPYMFSEKVQLEDGDVICTDDEIYYIYHSDHTCSYGVQIYRDHDLPECETFMIAASRYYTDFKQIEKFDTKNEDVHVIGIAGYEEKQKIAALYEQYKKKTCEHHPKKVEKKKHFLQKTNLSEGAVYETKKGCKVMVLLNEDSIHYGVDLYSLSEKTQIIDLSGVNYRYLYTCDEDELYDVLENVLVSEEITTQFQKKLLSKYYN